jgi:outer membrane protein TolC
MEAASRFDPLFQSELGHGREYRALSAGLGLSSTAVNTTDLTLRATRPLRNGMTADTSVGVNRTTDSATAPFGLNQSHLAFSVTVPLMRGRGREIATASEAAAGRDLEASTLDLTQSLSDLLSQTADAYWSAVAASRIYGVYRDAEDRGRVYLETVQALIAADRLPGSEISQVQGNLASRAAARLAAQQQLSQASQQLAIAVGTESAQLRAVPVPSDPLPIAQVQQAEGIDDRAVLQWIDQALTRRADLLALRRRESSATILRTAAQNQLRSPLDLQVSTGYTGFGEGRSADRYLASPFTGVRGADVIGTLRYELPVGRRAAQASLLEADSVVRQAGYRINEATRTITSEVIVATDGIRHAAAQLRQAQLSVQYSQLALENEREKLRLGVGSLLDVLTVEERLTNVLVFEVQSEAAFATAIAQLRHATGTIVAPDQTVSAALDADVFMTLPERE